MAARPVNLCPDLQGWHSAGLSVLYFPGVDTRELMLRAAREAQSAAAPKNAPSRQKNAAAPARAAATPAQSHAAPDAATQPDRTAMNIADAARAAAASAPLPKAWETVLDKVRPAPVVWTYLELGEDLMIKGDPARSAALKELIGCLGLKSGTSAFLPPVLPGRPADGSEGWCFQALLQRLGGRILVSIGPEALALGPYAQIGLEPFQEKIIQGRMLLCLPGFAEILASPARFEATRVFLRTAFAKINIL